MGIDIAMVAERRRRDGDWERAEPLALAGEVYVWYREGDPALIRVPVYSGRNRGLYEMLAWGVRVSAGEAEEWLVRPVAHARGMPDDATAETLAEAENDLDGYGTSWVTVAELEAHDWNQQALEKTTRCVALEPGGEATGWETVGVPPEGSNWRAAGATYTTHFGAVLQDFVRPAGYTYREACQDFLNDTLPKLRAFGSPNDVRIVFWFT